MPRRLSHIDAINVSEALKKICTINPAGHAQYESGHSDETVAAAVGVSKTGVAGLRRKLYGNLFATGGGPRKQDDLFLQERVERLEKQMAQVIATFKIKTEDA